MSGAQPPPRIRMRRPFTRKRRPPFGVDSEVISRMPNRRFCRSETRPPLTNSRDRSYSSGLPSSAGHQRCGFAKCSCGKLSGVKRTNALSCGRSVTDRLNATVPIRPRNVPLTACEVRFFRLAATVRSALRRVPVSTRLTTSGLRTTTSPLALRYAGCHSPMFLSGGDGFQSTQVVCRSGGVGAKTSTARAFVAPPLMGPAASPRNDCSRASVMSKSYRRYVPATADESARRRPFSQTFAR